MRVGEAIAPGPRRRRPTRAACSRSATASSAVAAAAAAPLDASQALRAYAASPRPLCPAPEAPQLLRLDRGHRPALRVRPRDVHRAAPRRRPRADARRPRPAHPRPAPQLRGRRRCSAGIAPASTSRARLPLLSTYLGHATRVDLLLPAGRPGAARARRRAPRRASGAGHERARPDAAGVLHRAPDRPAPGQPEHDRRLPRHVPAAARRSPQQQHRQDRQRSCDLDDLDAAADRRVPGPPRARARQQHRAPATPGWRRSARCSATPRSGTPSTPTRSRACSRSRPNAAQRTLVTFLTDEEIDALLAAPDRARWTGRRDHALLLTR